jgi:outer membrane protein TolC
LTYGGELKQYNARIALQKIQMKQTIAQVNEEVISAREQILAAKEQTEVALEGSRLGEQALEQSIARQQLGTIRPFEILQAMEIYIKSRLDHLKAVSTYNKAQYKLLVAMGNDL